MSARFQEALLAALLLPALIANAAEIPSIAQLVR
jgi:hypothetical protein